MPEIPNRPPSLKTIKRRATTIRKQRGCRHSEALDLAAQEFGYPNFAVAKRELSCKSELSSKLEALDHDPMLKALSRGWTLYKAGKPAPLFTGGNDVTVGGWLLGKAGVATEVGAGRGRRVYDALIELANDYTDDRGFAETLVMQTMDVLGKLCSPRAATRLREYAEDQYFAFGETVGY